MEQQEKSLIDYSSFNEKYKKILITGGLGFIGSNLIFRLLNKTNAKVFNIDKLIQKTNLLSFNNQFSNHGKSRYQFLNYDLKDNDFFKKIFKESDPDIIFHLAAESHVDRSIESPRNFLDSNVIGTFNLLENSLSHYNNLPKNRKNNFKFLHISTDEVFGSLGKLGLFNENSNYNPMSPYSATKAASDHLVDSWFHTFGLPTLVSNCSNNFGPRQFPDKLIPKIIINAINAKPIPIYGNGLNIRDWLFVEDHINALLLMADKGKPGSHYCIGGSEEKSNIIICNKICNLLDNLKPQKSSYSSLIEFVDDRPGHDFRYGIDSSLIFKELGWKPLFKFDEKLKETTIWYLKNQDWVKYAYKLLCYKGERLGFINNL
tara:strand:- start:4214 stop:5335 length:1122 start_codon:yes stop_codon:yes gene_type:complete